MHTLVLLLGVEGSAALSDAGEHVVIAKSCGPRAPLVAWTVLPPSLVVWLSWADEYGVFAARVPARAGSSVIVDNAMYPACDRTTYRYRNHVFEPVAPLEDGLPKKHYGIVNESSDAMAFGLLQRVTTADHESVLPVSFAALSPGVPADLIPDEDVVVWSDVTTAAGTVVSAAPPRALVIPSDGRRSQCCMYDVSANAFVWLGGR